MSIDSSTIGRRTRFERSSEPEGFQRTDRVIAILRFLSRFRYATTEQIAEFVGGSYDKVQRLLRKMYDHELIDRPAAQRFQLAAHANRPLVYVLAHAGARIVAAADGTPLSSFNWTTKTKKRTSETILHAI